MLGLEAVGFNLHDGSLGEQMASAAVASKRKLGPCSSRRGKRPAGGRWRRALACVCPLGGAPMDGQLLAAAFASPSRVGPGRA